VSVSAASDVSPPPRPTWRPRPLAIEGAPSLA